MVLEDPFLTGAGKGAYSLDQLVFSEPTDIEAEARCVKGG